MKYLLLIIFVISSYQLFCQVDEVFVVTSEKLNLRSGPGIENKIIGQLTKGQEVVVTEVPNADWYKIGYRRSEAYVASSKLTNDPEWIKRNLRSGTDPACENIKPYEKNELDNYLKISVGSHTDVVVKLMKINSVGNDVCISIVYVRSNESFSIKNIPEGNYFLKIAYGEDWRQKIENDTCYGKFMKWAVYEKGKDKLDFNRVITGDGYSLPSFELSLDILIKPGIGFPTNSISEEEFNK